MAAKRPPAQYEWSLLMSQDRPARKQTTVSSRKSSSGADASLPRRIKFGEMQSLYPDFMSKWLVSPCVFFMQTVSEIEQICGWWFYSSSLEERTFQRSETREFFIYVCMEGTEEIIELPFGITGEQSSINPLYGYVVRIVALDENATSPDAMPGSLSDAHHIREVMRKQEQYADAYPVQEIRLKNKFLVRRDKSYLEAMEILKDVSSSSEEVRRAFKVIDNASANHSWWLDEDTDYQEVEEVLPKTSNLFFSVAYASARKSQASASIPSASVWEPWVVTMDLEGNEKFALFRLQ